MRDYRTPGVYWEEGVSEARISLRTAIPLFLGFALTPEEYPKNQLTHKPLCVSKPLRSSDQFNAFRWECAEIQTHGSLVKGKVFKEDDNRVSLQTVEGAVEDYEIEAAVRTKLKQHVPGEAVMLVRGNKILDVIPSLVPIEHSYMPPAVNGFFRNGGQVCFAAVIPVSNNMLSDAVPAFENAIKELRHLHMFDLLCAPDIFAPPIMKRMGSSGAFYESEVGRMQKALLQYCDWAGDCFAILDAFPALEAHGQVQEQRKALTSMNGAIYYPWLVLSDGDGRIAPPCGHVAGVYARTDERTGVHKAPANEVIEGVIDLAVLQENSIEPLRVNVTTTDQDKLNPLGINCIRAFPGRGIRVWGARTMSGQPTWAYVNVRRLFITAIRWIEENLADVPFEPNTEQLWASIERDLRVYFTDMFRQGAIKGETADEAFYVKCDEETNPSELRERGAVVTEIGLSPSVPNEFVVVRITCTPTGMTISGPGWATA